MAHMNRKEENPEPLVSKPPTPSKLPPSLCGENPLWGKRTKPAKKTCLCGRVLQEFDDSICTMCIKYPTPKNPIWVDPPDCPRCGHPLKPLESVYGQWQCPNHFGEKSVWFDYELIMILRARTPKIQTFPYLVVGDHPTLARPDKRFPDVMKAAAFAEELRQTGYENVAVFKKEELS